MSWVRDVGIQLAADIGGLGHGVATSFVWVPEVHREQTSNEMIIVTPMSRSVSSASRGCKLRQVSYGVLYIAPLAQTSEDNQVEFSQLDIAERLDTLLGAKVLTMSITKIAQDAIVDGGLYRNDRLLSAAWTIELEGF